MNKRRKYIIPLLIVVVMLTTHLGWTPSTKPTLKSQAIKGAGPALAVTVRHNEHQLSRQQIQQVRSTSEISSTVMTKQSSALEVSCIDQLVTCPTAQNRLSFRLGVQRNVYPSVEDYVGGTPLVRLQRLPGKTSNTILAKLEGNNPAGSVKDRYILSNFCLVQS